MAKIQRKPDSFAGASGLDSQALGRWSRRQVLSSAGAAWSWSLSRWAVAAAPPTQRAKARSVILIFNSGAPSHIDLWDPKPEAPDNVRGLFQPIETNVAGIQVSELLPKIARHMDKLAILRTVHHQHSSHNAGMHWSIVGRPYRVDSTLINPSRTDYPCLGTLVGWLAQGDGYARSLPPYVITPAPHCDSTVYITPGQYGGCLGSRFDPFVLHSDPNASEFRVPNVGLADGLTADRLQQRSDLLGRIEQRTQSLAEPLARDMDLNRGRAMTLTVSDEMRRAFDLAGEPAHVRERYGRTTWGQSHLLARRLVEAGVPFVTTVNGPSIVWDTHQDNFNRLKERLVPPTEQAFAALLEDLSERGLLDHTIVIWMGDFGRTPIINAEAGRDHWPNCYSMVVAGGGLRGGQIIGESDAKGGYPISHPITPADVHATVFTALGYDPQSIVYHTADGRPTPLSDGQPIRGLL